MNLRLLPLSFALVTALAACSDKAAPAADAATPPPADGATATADTPPATAATAGRIHVQVTGGANAGTYDIADTDGCSYNIAEKGAWGNQFSRDAAATDVSSVQLIVPDAKAAAAGTDRFLLTVGFGPQFGAGGTSYTVDTRAGKGTGTVKIDDRNDSGTVTFDGTTADGVHLQGTIDCATVTRA